MNKQMAKLFNLPVVLTYRLFSDGELMKKVKRKDNMAFDVLYERYVDRVWSYIFYKVHSQERAFELTQDVFLKLFNKADLYDEEKKFSSWMWSLVRNHLVDDFKAKDALAPSSSRAELFNHINGEEDDNRMEDVLFDDHGADQLFELVLSKSNLNQIKECFTKLPANQLEVLSLKIFSDQSIEEIALGIKKKSGAVKSLLFRARDSLRLCLERSGLI